MTTEQKEQKLQKLEQEARKAFAHGGPFAHNIIRMALQEMQGIDNDRAQAVFKDLQEEGY